MSTIDDQAKEVTEEPGHKNEGNEPGEGSGGFIVLFFIIGFIASLLIGWVVFPKLLYSQKNQPVTFNHVIHMEEVDGCESCHFFRDDGSYAGVPKLNRCIECHEEPQDESNEDEVYFISEYVTDYEETGREVPWLIYSKQPDCVFFSHAAHVKKAEIDCITCHGPIGESEKMPVYQENRITGYSREIWGKNISGLKKNPWDRMKMNDCADCHKESGVMVSSVQTEKDACFVCHK